MIRMFTIFIVFTLRPYDIIYKLYQFKLNAFHSIVCYYVENFPNFDNTIYIIFCVLSMIYQFENFLYCLRKLFVLQIFSFTFFRLFIEWRKKRSVVCCNSRLYITISKIELFTVLFVCSMLKHFLVFALS
jgi:hypothetical protein